MREQERELLDSLLTGRPVLALAVLVEGRPCVGQLPFAWWRERGSLLVHVSALARHSRGLSEGAPFSALVGGETGDGEDPFRIPRLTLEGSAHPLARGAPEYGEAREAYLARQPTGGRHFQLGDFALIELGVERGRLVAGLARTFNLTAGHLRDDRSET